MEKYVVVRFGLNDREKENIRKHFVYYLMDDGQPCLIVVKHNNRPFCEEYIENVDSESLKEKLKVVPFETLVKKEL